jgi:hypothetical protein
MKSTVLISDRKQICHALVLLAAMLLAAAVPSYAQGQQKRGGGKASSGKAAGAPPANGENMSSAGAGVNEADSGNEDAGDEEMLTGEAPSSGIKRPGEAAKGEEGPVPELSFVTRLDKTAVWVGDQFHYQVIVDHAPKIQFVMENVNKDTINMDPLRVMDVTSSSTPLKDGNIRLFVDLTLSNFTTGADKLQIPQLTLFYFRREGAAATVNQNAEGSAAESLTIPGPVIGLRSTLPPDPPDLRDAVTVSGWAQSRWYIAGIGWVCLVVVVAGAGYEGYTTIRFRRGRKGPDPRKAMAAIHDRWSQYVPGDFNDANSVMDFYGRSYTDVKEYLAYLLETHTEGLTAEDMRAEMGRLAANPDLTERTAKVLAICETARYGRNGKELIGDAARGVAHDIREIFESGARLM